LSGWAGEFDRCDIAPGFVGDDLEFAHAVVDHGLDLTGLLIDHRDHDDTGEQRDHADGRSRDSGDIR